MRSVIGPLFLIAVYTEQKVQCLKRLLGKGKFQPGQESNEVFFVTLGALNPSSLRRIDINIQTIGEALLLLYL